MPKESLVTKIICSDAIDPWYNLALEEYFLDNIKENEILLYLWQNKDTVVIGRNQNPWKECRCKELEANGGHLARRLSGGGAVFHDLGNLNFTFIMNKKYYDLDKQLKVILNAVRNQGLDANFTGRNDLVLDGKKFSGNAFYYKKQSAYHHGTILIDSDLSKLVKYLQISKEKIESKGIDSVRSRVINLKSKNPSMNVEDMKNSLVKSFIHLYGGTGEKMSIHNDEIIENLYKKYSSWDWRYSETPSFDITFSNRFKWGGIELGLQLKNGHIKSAMLYSDALLVDLMDEIALVLNQTPFDIKSMVEKIITIKTSKENENQIIEDICKWLLTK